MKQFHETAPIKEGNIYCDIRLSTELRHKEFDFDYIVLRFGIEANISFYFAICKIKFH